MIKYRLPETYCKLTKELYATLKSIERAVEKHYNKILVLLDSKNQFDIGDKNKKNRIQQIIKILTQSANYDKREIIICHKPSYVNILKVLLLTYLKLTLYEDFLQYINKKKLKDWKLKMTQQIMLTTFLDEW